MRGERIGRLCRFLKIAALSVAGLAAILAVAYFVLGSIASARVAEARKRWAEAGLPITDFARKYPVQEDSAEALALDSDALKLGFSLRETGDNIVQKENAKAWNLVSVPVNDYLKILESPEPPLAPPPEAVARFISENSATISDIRERLNHEAPKWKMDLGNGYSSQVPNVVGQFALAKLISADCLSARFAGDNKRANEDADAVWRLSGGLAQRPELISQLIVIAMRKILLAELRTLQDAPAVWIDRLNSWNPRESLITSYQHDASLLDGGFKETQLEMIRGKHLSWKDRAMAPFSLVYVRFCIAGAENIFLDSLQRLRKCDICDSDDKIQEAGRLDENEIPRWNVIARIGLPDLTDVWLRAKYIRIQTELTTKILEIKAARAAGGAWPAQAPGIEKSFCANEHWVYSVDRNGWMSLAYSGAEPGKNVVKGFRPPQEYKEGPLAGEGARGRAPRSRRI